MEKNPFFDFLNKIQNIEDKFYKAVNKDNLDNALKLLLEMRNIHGYLIVNQSNLINNSKNFHVISCLHTIIYMINDIIMEADEYLDDNIIPEQNTKINKSQSQSKLISEQEKNIVEPDELETANYNDKKLFDLLNKKLNKKSNINSKINDNTLLLQTTSNDGNISSLLSEIISNANITFDNDRTKHESLPFNGNTNEKRELLLFNGNANSKEVMRIQIIKELDLCKNWDANYPTICYFYLDSCGACVETRPKWNEIQLLVKQYNDKYNILEFDLNDEKNEKLRNILNVVVVPTFYILSKLDNYNYTTNNYTGKNINKSVLLNSLINLSDKSEKSEKSDKKNYKLKKKLLTK